MQKIKETFQNLCSGGPNKKILFTISQKMQIYQDVVNGNLENIKKLFINIEKRNFGTLKFTDVII
jgi:hypothetical protein